ncbi:hypothetical protein SJI45_17660 [Streptomyces sp. S399]|uniref:hypothetical protein n=1 Tax=Streptomyces sp. S399 TaxID=3096009 RepID=UPI002A82A7AC|nr:hypothetical protein [Streptomyces sp. S399]WPR52588.1 hypothetical protein SJI45_17660 [Streptomyces sp. S399]
MLDEDDGPAGRARLAGLLVDRPGADEAARVEALHARAALHCEAREYAEALADHDRLDALRPGDWRTAVERGVAHRRAGNYVQALSHLDEAEARLAAAPTPGTIPRRGPHRPRTGGDPAPPRPVRPGPGPAGPGPRTGPGDPPRWSHAPPPTSPWAGTTRRSPTSTTRSPAAPTTSGPC